MITVRFLSGLERRLGLSENTLFYEGPAPVYFRVLCEQLNIHSLDTITKPLLVNCLGETFAIDKAFAKLYVPDGETAVIFMINGGG